MIAVSDRMKSHCLLISYTNCYCYYFSLLIISSDFWKFWKIADFADINFPILWKVEYGSPFIYLYYNKLEHFCYYYPPFRKYYDLLEIQKIEFCEILWKVSKVDWHSIIFITANWKFLLLSTVSKILRLESLKNFPILWKVK